MSEFERPDMSREGRSGANAPEFSVSELSGAIKRALEEGFGYVRLKGEISGYRGPHASGHCYFALKDDKAKIEAVIWKGTFGRLRFKPQEGLEVVAQGKITTFPGSSKYQIVIEALEPAGAGALMALLEERKRKFAAEGLFEETRKKPRPFLPRVIGIVTSPTGAVIRDMLHGFDERFPAHVVVWPVRVQGEGSAQEVANAIRGFNAFPPAGAFPRPDVLIVARGGGALEDLWGFNEEVVVRAAAESVIPLISAVGHETDWTLIDLVADARAPTPTKAAEWAVPKFSELAEAVDQLGQRQRSGIRRYLDETRNTFRAEARGLPKLEDLIALPRQRFDGAAGRLDQGLRGLLQRKKTGYAQVSATLRPSLLGVRFGAARRALDRLAQRQSHCLGRFSNLERNRFERVASRLRPGQIAARIAECRKDLGVLERRGAQALMGRITLGRRRLDGEANMLRTLSYQSVLARGFALVRREDGAAVRVAAALSAGARIVIEFADGKTGAQVTDSQHTVPQVTGPMSSISDRPQAKSTARTQRVRAKTDGQRGESDDGSDGGGQGSLF